MQYIYPTHHSESVFASSFQWWQHIEARHKDGAFRYENTFLAISVGSSDTMLNDKSCFNTSYTFLKNCIYAFGEEKNSDLFSEVQTFCDRLCPLSTNRQIMTEHLPMYASYNICHRTGDIMLAHTIITQFHHKRTEFSFSENQVFLQQESTNHLKSDTHPDSLASQPLWGKNRKAVHMHTFGGPGMQFSSSLFTFQSYLNFAHMRYAQI